MLKMKAKPLAAMLIAKAKPAASAADGGGGDDEGLSQAGQEALDAIHDGDPMALAQAIASICKMSDYDEPEE